REIELRLQLADLQAQRMGQIDAALANYEKVYALNPASAEARDAVERIYRQKERWSDVARLLDEKAKRTDDPGSAAKIRKERAELLERVGDVDASIAVLEAEV